MAQPLDVSFFGPLKKHWGEVCHDFCQESASNVVTKFNFTRLFADAWQRATLPSTICSGFRKCGIVPFNKDALAVRYEECSSDTNPEESIDSDLDENSNAGDISSNKENDSNTGNIPAQAAPAISAEKEKLFETRYEGGVRLLR